jgi:hypothetical protein
MGGNRGDIGLAITTRLIFPNALSQRHRRPSRIEPYDGSRVKKRERMPAIDTLLRMVAALEIHLGKFLARALKE